MVQSTRRIYILITVVGTFVVATTLAGGLIFGPFHNILPDSWEEKLGYQTSTGSEITVQLVIDYNGEKELFNESIFFSENQTATAFSILEIANISVKTNTQPNGIYVEAIGGIEENSTHYWWYYIDGESGGVASNRYDLRVNNAATVTWIFKKS
jgi:hypothetical protein